MNAMITISAPQGSEEWKAERRAPRTYTASEASAMMGDSKHETRGELMYRKKTGIEKEVTPAQQARYNAGHAAEFAARPFVAAMMGASLSPVTGYIEVDGMRLLASFDGYDMIDDVIWENKLWNTSIVADIAAEQLHPHYVWQLEQQLLVSGATRAYFTTSDGTQEKTRGMWYESVPELRARLIAGWKQFAEDLANYQHVEHAERPAAQVSIELPALFVQAKGQIIDSNMVAYGEALKNKLAEVRAIVLATDQDFSNAKAAASMFRDQIKKLKLTKEAMLSQTVTVGEAARMMDAWSEDLRLTALQLEKDVEKEDLAKKAAIVTTARQAIEKHVTDLNRRIGGTWMPQASAALYSEAIKGKRLHSSMQDAVDTALANEKIRLNGIADTIEENRKTLEAGNGDGMDYFFLVPDFSTVCTKARDDFDALVSSRLAAHRAAESEKVAAAKKAEDDRVAAAVEAERLAGEARAAAAVEAERMAEAKRAAEAAKPAYAVCEQHTDDQRGKTADATHAVQQATELPQAPAAITPPTPEEKRAILVDSGDDVRAYLNTLDVSDKERGRLRAVLQGFVQFQAQRRPMAVAA